jgi:hypothetical protein
VEVKRSHDSEAELGRGGKVEVKRRYDGKAERAMCGHGSEEERARRSDTAVEDDKKDHWEARRGSDEEEGIWRLAESGQGSFFSGD